MRRADGDVDDRRRRGRRELVELGFRFGIGFRIGR
jgi:hypothetical protein